MLTRTIVFIFIFASLALSIGCNEEPKQQTKPQVVIIEQSDKAKELHKKMTEGEFTPSSGKGWKP